MPRFETQPGDPVWGYGTESGTLEKVYISGKDVDDVRAKAMRAPYFLILHAIWRPEAEE